MVNKLKEYRERAGITQRRLAQLIGTTDTTINAIEHRKTNPLLGTAIKISLVLKADFADLWQIDSQKFKCPNSKGTIKTTMEL